MAGSNGATLVGRPVKTFVMGPLQGTLTTFIHLGPQSPSSGESTTNTDPVVCAVKPKGDGTDPGASCYTIPNTEKGGTKTLLGNLGITRTDLSGVFSQYVRLASPSPFAAQEIRDKLTYAGKCSPSEKMAAITTKKEALNLLDPTSCPNASFSLNLDAIPIFLLSPTTDSPELRLLASHFGVTDNPAIHNWDIQSGGFHMLIIDQPVSEIVPEFRTEIEKDKKLR